MPNPDPQTDTSANVPPGPSPELPALVPQQFLREIVECATNAVAAFDLQGRYIFVNDRTCELSGYTREELVGKSVGEVLLIPMDGTVFAELRQALLEGAPVDAIEADIRHKDGTTGRSHSPCVRSPTTREGSSASPALPTI